MIIDVISDLHGFKPELKGGDLLIVAGDLTACDKQSQYLDFREWLGAQNYKKKIFICGNHDMCIENGNFYFSNGWFGAEYLCDSGTEFEGRKIWGSPRTPLFDGVNIRCTAFMSTEEVLNEKFSLIPDDIDILITHGPMLGVLDINKQQQHCGSKSLKKHINRVKPALHIFGHIHEQGGNETVYKCEGVNTWCVNCSYVDGDYKPVNTAIRLEI
jgi:Icc-related predicted phosphoesterase